MPLTTVNLQWANLNSQRRYPLADDASARDDSDSFSLPDDFLIELDLPVHAGLAVDPARFFVKNVVAFADGYALTVGYQPEEGAALDVATTLVARSTHTRNRAYSLVGVDNFADSAGKVVIGRLAGIDQEPPGFWTFTLDGGRLDADAIRPIIRGVSSIVLVNGTEESEPLTGDVRIRAGTNCQLVVVRSAGEDPIVQVNFLDGEGTLEGCACAGDPELPPVRSIAGVRPDADGNIDLVGSSCLQVEPFAHGLRLDDTCAKPCCGCVELEKVTRELERLLREADGVSQFVNQLQDAVAVMHDNVLGTRLSDRGCLSYEDS